MRSAAWTGIRASWKKVDFRTLNPLTGVMSDARLHNSLPSRLRLLPLGLLLRLARS